MGYIGWAFSLRFVIERVSFHGVPVGFPVVLFVGSLFLAWAAFCTSTELYV